ncbi:ABC transporter permease [Rhodoligotrophos ferricapiens]|uniref:ABC transporter permease n=1 Tax=Rhodoligotrophos ferricapiens TaxID=3069264 RepID=UPI00315D3761
MRSISWRLLNGALLAILPLPFLLIAAISVSPDRFMAFPPSGFSLTWYYELVSNSEWTIPIAVSAMIAAGTAVLSTAIAICAVLATDGLGPRLRALIDMAVFAPLIFPHAAVGIAMLGFLLTLHVRGTMVGILLVHIILCVPFAYRPISVSIQNIDSSLAEASMSLGADSRTTFWRVILPLMKPGIVTALIFTFILSFDEATVTLFLISPDVITLPVRVFSRVRDAADPVVPAISTLLVFITLMLVIVVERTVGLQLFVNPKKE